MIDQGLVLSVFVLALCALGLSWFAGTDAPYVPTKNADLKKILRVAGIRKGKIFYELGSGDGRVVLEASQMGADSFGIEQSWIRVLFSRIQAKKRSLHSHFYHGNIFDREYYPADIVYIYMLQPCVNTLEKKLRKELKKGAVVITQKYHFKSWKPTKKLKSFWIYKKV